MNKNKSKLIITLSAITTIVLIFFYVWLFFYIKSLNEKSSILRGDIAVSNGEKTQVLSTKSALVSTEEERVKLSDYFINQNQVVYLIERLESLGKTSGTSLNLTSIDTDKKQKNLLRFSLKINGSFENIYYLLSLLESLPYEMNITRFSVNKSDDLSTKQKSVWDSEVSVELLSFISE